MPCHCPRFSLRPALSRALFLVGFTLLTANQSRAYDDQASLDLSAGAFRIAANDTLAGLGTELNVGGSYGLGDMFVLRASLGYAARLDRKPRLSIGRARVEAAYLIDVLSVVPFFGLGTSLWLRFDEVVNAVPSAHGLAGLDWLITREMTLGIDVRLGLALFSGSPVSTLEGQLRWSRMFDLL